MKNRRFSEFHLRHLRIGFRDGPEVRLHHGMGRDGRKTGTRVGENPANGWVPG